MTLHWWMHWFWVTLLITLASSLVTAAPQSEELQHISTDYEIEERLEQPRQGRAMYIPKAVQTTTKPPLNNTKDDVLPKDPVTTQPPIQWTPVNATDLTKTESEEHENAETTTAKPEPTTATPDTNLTESLSAEKKPNVTKQEFVKDDVNIESALESRIVTDKPLSLETTFLQTRIPPNTELYRRVGDDADEGMDTGAIAGISFAALVLAALAGSTAFIMYRRRYLNKPQTLNDKCSNPDSSGYLDDSTIRDNSEEMYSLDNDSFLNSLEAMTIQNYWTDTVKHTKL